MPRFLTPRDFEFMQKINRELISEIIDNIVILYKAHPEATKTNIYGESSQKIRYTGIQLAAYIKYGDNTPRNEGYGYDTNQEVEFHFVRRLLEEVNVLPEEGDIIKFNDLYYEIHNTTDTQLIGNRPEFSTSIICKAHLTRKSNLNIEPRQV
jgi:hypothetical protein